MLEKMGIRRYQDTEPLNMEKLMNTHGIYHQLNNQKLNNQNNPKR